MTSVRHSCTFAKELTEQVAELTRQIHEYRLRTSDPGAARRVAAETPELRVLPDDELLHRHDAAALLVRAAEPALDDLVARLVGAGVSVRELAPVVAPLEAAFLALTAGAKVPSEDGGK